MLQVRSESLPICPNFLEGIGVSQCVCLYPQGYLVACHLCGPSSPMRGLGQTSKRCLADLSSSLPSCLPIFRHLSACRPVFLSVEVTSMPVYIHVSLYM